MIKQVNKIVIIHLENYYQGDIKIENGLPKKMMKIIMGLECYL